MRYGKKKVLSGLTMVTVLLVSLFSVMPTGRVTAAVHYGDVKPAHPRYHYVNETQPSDEHSYITGHIHLTAPEPKVTTDDADGWHIWCYIGHPKCYVGENGDFIIATAIGKHSWFYWHVRGIGTHQANVTFDVLLSWYTVGEDGKKIWTAPILYKDKSETVVQTTIFGEEGDEGGANNSICFLAGTKVLMDDLSVKNIEEIQPGDLVKSLDMLTGDVESDTVVEVITHTPEEMKDGYRRITVDNTSIVRVTPNHPIMVLEDDFIRLQNTSDPSIQEDDTEFAFIKAGDLRVGDKIFNRTITSIERYPDAKEYSYNLVLENNLNYVVVDDSALQVHTTSDVLDGWNDLGEQMITNGSLYQPLIAPGVKGNSASPVYFEGVDGYALPLLKP